MSQHKSSTHPEYFFHIRDEETNEPFATVFIRKEVNEDIPGWYGSASVCHENDQFCRSTGRSIARRKYFNGDVVAVDVENNRPTYDDAIDVALMFGVQMAEEIEEAA